MATKKDVEKLGVAIHRFAVLDANQPLVGWSPNYCTDCIYCRFVAVKGADQQVPTCSNPANNLHYLERKALACCDFLVRTDTNELLRHAQVAGAAGEETVHGERHQSLLERIRDTEDLLLKISALGGVVVVVVETTIRAVFPLLKIWRE